MQTNLLPVRAGCAYPMSVDLERLRTRRPALPVVPRSLPPRHGYSGADPGCVRASHQAAPAPLRGSGVRAPDLTDPLRLVYRRLRLVHARPEKVAARPNEESPSKPPTQTVSLSPEEARQLQEAFEQGLLGPDSHVSRMLQNATLRIQNTEAGKAAANAKGPEQPSHADAAGTPQPDAQGSGGPAQGGANELDDPAKASPDGAGAVGSARGDASDAPAPNAGGEGADFSGDADGGSSGGSSPASGDPASGELSRGAGDAASAESPNSQPMGNTAAAAGQSGGGSGYAPGLGSATGRRSVLASKWRPTSESSANPEQAPPAAPAPAPAKPTNEAGQTASERAATAKDIDALQRASEQQGSADVAPAEQVGSYRRWSHQYQQVIAAVSGELEEFFERQSHPQWVGHFRKGTFDLAKAIAAENLFEATGRDDPNVYVQRSTPRDFSAGVMLCIDTSGSMAGDKVEAARRALVVFLRVLEDLQIPCGILQFDDYSHVVKELDENLTEPQLDVVVDSLHARGSRTEDYGALKHAAACLEPCAAAQRIILFLTDGNGAGDRVRRLATDLEMTENIATVGIGIGAGVDFVRTTFPHHVAVTDLTQLPKELGGVLLECLQPDT